jgi:hypothetical protein
MSPGVETATPLWEKEGPSQACGNPSLGKDKYLLVPTKYFLAPMIDILRLLNKKILEISVQLYIRN